MAASPPPLFNVAKLIDQGTRLLLSWWGQEFVKTVTYSDPPPAPTPRVIDTEPIRLTAAAAPPEPSPSAERDVKPECPSCRVHQDVSGAKGHVESILWAARQYGGIVVETRPELYLAREQLNDARAATAAVRAKAPSLAVQCDKMSGCIERAASTIPEPTTATVEQCESLLAALVEAHAQSTQLAIDYEQLVKRSQGNERLRALASRYGVTDPDGFFRDFSEELTNG